MTDIEAILADARRALGEGFTEHTFGQLVPGVFSVAPWAPPEAPRPAPTHILTLTVTPITAEDV